MTISDERAPPAALEQPDAADELRLLIIEDNRVDATMVRALLADELGETQRSVWAQTLGASRAPLQSFTPSCVLLDLGLPDSEGLDTLREVIALAPETPVVVFTGLDDERAGQEAVTNGAQDYLVKGKTNGSLLVRSIRYAVERKRAETARRWSEERFHLAVDSLVDPLFIMRSVRDAAGEIVDFTYDYANGAACALLRLPPENLIGRHLLDVAPAHRGELFAAYRRLVETGEPLTGERRYEGRLGNRAQVAVVMDVSAVRLGDGYLMSARDATARKSAEEALLASEERFRALIEHSTDIILVIHADGRLLYASPAAQRVLGHDPASLVGTSALDLVHPDDLPDVAATLAATASEPGVAPPAIYRVRDAKGAWRWIESIANNRLEEPSIRGIVINARDITEQRQSALSLDDLNRVLRTLTAADTALVHAVEEAALFDAMCELIVEVGGYAMAWIAAPDPSRPSGLVPVASHGGDTSFLTAVLEASGGEPMGPVAEAAHREITRVVQDIAELPAGLPHRQVALEHGYRSLIALPLPASDDLVGTLAIYSRHHNAFHADEILLLERLAADLAYGVTALRTRAERQQYFEQLERSLGALIQTIATTVEYRDPYTAGHQRRVAKLAGAIAREIGLDASTTAGIETAANIHDLGKISIPAEILSKPGYLTPPEFELVKQHVQAGYEIVKGIEFRWPVPEMILQHHERMDGSGYLAGLVGSDILLGARIIAVADTIEAMATHRPYRPSLGIGAALRQVEQDRGTLFDPDVVDACLVLFRQRGFTFETT